MTTLVRGSENFKVVISVEKPLDILEGVEFVSSPKCGATNAFLGNIRDTETKLTMKSNGCPETIRAIRYEAYDSMVLSQTCDIVEGTINSPQLECGDSATVDPNSRAYVSIRLGFTPVQETSIIICVSSTSRKCSHLATMTILEKIKSNVPIWKKIVFMDGHEEWADAKSEASWIKSKAN